MPAWTHWLVPLLLVPGIWAGTTIGNFGSIAMGRGGRPLWLDWLGLMAHGLLGVALPALVLWWWGYAWWWCAASGALISPLYDLGWRISGKVGNRNLPNGLRGGSELGEAFWGAAVAAGVFLAVIG